MRKMKKYGRKCGDVSWVREWGNFPKKADRVACGVLYYIQLDKIEFAGREYIKWNSDVKLLIAKKH